MLSQGFPIKKKDKDMIVYIAGPLKESWYDHLWDEMEVHTVVPPQLTQKIASKIASSNTSFNKPVFLGGEVKRLPNPRVSENAGSQFC